MYEALGGLEVLGLGALSASMRTFKHIHISVRKYKGFL